MSPRAACRLETLGFREVHDYMPGKIDWLARGLPREGEEARELRAGELARENVVTCALRDPAREVLERIEASPHGFALVISERRLLLGRLRRSAIEVGSGRTAEELMEPGPSTVRAHLPAEQLVERLLARGLQAALVTGPDGELIGVVRRDEAEDRRKKTVTRQQGGGA